jgi:hypothetical protein
MKLLAILVIITFTAAANAQCISNGSDPVENGTFCTNQPDEPNCDSYDGCQWLDNQVPIPSQGYCYSNGNDPVENGNFCGNQPDVANCDSFDGCMWLEGN